MTGDTTDQTCQVEVRRGYGRISGSARCGKPATVPIEFRHAGTVYYCRRHANRILKERAEREAAEHEAAREMKG